MGLGEIGLNKNSRNELKVLEMHVDLAARHEQLISVHTPHLEDKHKGTRLILDVLRGDKRIRLERCIIDHVEEHTIKMVLDAGFWAGMTLYPETKCTAARAVDMIELYGAERLWMNSACDWGVSVLLAVLYAALESARAATTSRQLTVWFTRIRSSSSVRTRDLGWRTPTKDEAKPRPAPGLLHQRSSRGDLGRNDGGVEPVDTGG